MRSVLVFMMFVLILKFEFLWYFVALV